MNTLFKDIRYGVRSLLRHPGFAAIAVKGTGEWVPPSCYQTSQPGVSQEGE